MRLYIFRTLVNGKSATEKRQEKSEKLRNDGNKSFQNGDFSCAEDLYTSAILEWDGDHQLFNNRAQARIKLGKVLYSSHKLKFFIRISELLARKNAYKSKFYRGCESDSNENA